MVRNVEAIYKDGMLHPVVPLRGIAEDALVRVTIEELPPHPALRHCFGIMPHEEAEAMRRVIDEEFGKVNPDEWQ